MPYWNTGQNELAGARLKMDADDRRLRALAGAVSGGQRAVSNYRAGGLMGVIDPAGEKERRNAEIEQAELETRLGLQQDEAEAAAEAEIPEAPSEAEFSGDPRDWLSTLADVGGAAAGAVARGPGGGHQRSLVELARYRGQLKAKEDDLARARALSSTIAGSTDPGALIEHVAPSLGVHKGDVSMRASAEHDPRSMMAMAWAKAREKAAKEGREATTEDAHTMWLELRNDDLRLKERFKHEKPDKPSEFDKQYERARGILRQQNGKEPTEREVWDFVKTRPMNEADKEWAATVREARERRNKKEGGGPLAGVAGRGGEGGAGAGAGGASVGGPKGTAMRDDDDLDLGEGPIGEDGLTEGQRRELFHGKQ